MGTDKDMWYIHKLLPHPTQDNDEYEEKPLLMLTTI